jgi:hypothetical protein
MSDLETTDIQQFLKSCANERKATRGLNEVARGLEQRRAVCAFLANDVSEDQYKKLIEALARDANIPLVKVDSAKNARRMGRPLQIRRGRRSHQSRQMRLRCHPRMASHGRRCHREIQGCRRKNVNIF